MRDIATIEKYKNYEEGLTSAIKIQLLKDDEKRKEGEEEKVAAINRGEFIFSAVPDQPKVIQRIQAFWEKCQQIEKAIKV
jgi:hypothetical protein